MGWDPFGGFREAFANAGIPQLDLAGSIANAPRVDAIGAIAGVVQQGFSGVNTAILDSRNVNFDLLGNLHNSAQQIGYDIGNAGVGIARGVNQAATDLTKHTTDQIEFGLRNLAGGLQTGAQRANVWGNEAIQDVGDWLTNAANNASGRTDKDKAAQEAQAILDQQNADIAQSKRDELIRKERQDFSASNKAGANQQGYTGGYNLGGSSVQNYNTSKDFLGL